MVEKKRKHDEIDEEDRKELEKDFKILKQFKRKKVIKTNYITFNLILFY
jgi:hypothetical protein